MATTVTYTFTSATKARSAQVNQNFTDLKTGINTLEAVGQYSTWVGNQGGVTYPLKTNLLGRFQAEYFSIAATMTIAAPGVVTQTAHGRITGDKCYFTTTGALPTGITASTTYWITKIDANTFKLSTSLANLVAATFITTSGSQSGTHTVYFGGIGIVENYQGALTGTTVPSGCIGETIEASMTTATATTSEADVPSGSLALTIGKWEIVYSVTATVNTGSSSGNESTVVVMVTDNSNTHVGRSERELSCKTVAAVAGAATACLASSFTVNLSANATYKLRCKRIDSSGTGTGFVYVNTGNYDSVFYAKRIA